MDVAELARWIMFIKEYIVKPQRKQQSPVRQEGGPPRLPGLRKPRKQ